ncbi:uncharacterized protein LOC126482143 [Schistocerca serialis cubense]|uniref:uncharacterized protein LOC126482143 n=1 Tax=Schistocerca serialis cubense TaxID=2023355 RepID=UPI00214E5D7A|nr:uncharacterized protein LOC126482143 [Schistocerca serialis cubense]
MSHQTVNIANGYSTAAVQRCVRRQLWLTWRPRLSRPLRGSQGTAGRVAALVASVNRDSAGGAEPQTPTSGDPRCTTDGSRTYLVCSTDLDRCPGASMVFPISPCCVRQPCHVWNTDNALLAHPGCLSPRTPPPPLSPPPPPGTCACPEVSDNKSAGQQSQAGPPADCDAARRGACVLHPRSRIVSANATRVPGPGRDIRTCRARTSRRRPISGLLAAIIRPPPPPPPYRISAAPALPPEGHWAPLMCLLPTPLSATPRRAAQVSTYGVPVRCLGEI